jgi:hypothetical protein
MHLITKILALMVALGLVVAAAGLSIINQGLFNTGETYYSSTEISDSGIQNTVFYNEGTTGYTSAQYADTTGIDKYTSADFGGFTVYSDLNVADGVGGEQTISVSNKSMSLDKHVSLTSDSLAASEDASLESEGESSFRSELLWWLDAKARKETTATIYPDIYNEGSIYVEGLGYYTTIYLSPLPINLSSTYIISK